MDVRWIDIRWISTRWQVRGSVRGKTERYPYLGGIGGIWFKTDWLSIGANFRFWVRREETSRETLGKPFDLVLIVGRSAWDDLLGLDLSCPPIGQESSEVGRGLKRDENVCVPIQGEMSSKTGSIAILTIVHRSRFLDYYESLGD